MNHVFRLFENGMQKFWHIYQKKLTTQSKVGSYRNTLDWDTLERLNDFASPGLHPTLLYKIIGGVSQTMISHLQSGLSNIIIDIIL